MATLPGPVEEFLREKRIAVAGVSRSPSQPANAIFRKLRAAGRDVVPINPNASELEGVTCYPDLASAPQPIGGVIVATHPAVSAAVVRQAADLGVRRVWFHRSFGQGSASDEALRECEAHGLQAIVGGCPLMYCEPVDLGHRCMRWWLARRGRVPR
jgi:uncharacterized protein